MTHDQMVEVIQAHKEGKTIQENINGRGWNDLRPESSILFGSENFNYRVKPEPREFTLLRRGAGGYAGSYEVRFDAPIPTERYGVEGIEEIIHVREVIE